MSDGKMLISFRQSLCGFLVFYDLSVEKRVSGHLICSLVRDRPCSQMRFAVGTLRTPQEIGTICMADAKIPRKVTIASKRRQNSEAQPQRQLDQPRIDGRATDLSEGRRIQVQAGAGIAA